MIILNHIFYANYLIQIYDNYLINGFMSEIRYGYLYI